MLAGESRDRHAQIRHLPIQRGATFVGTIESSLQRRSFVLQTFRTVAFRICFALRRARVLAERRSFVLQTFRTVAFRIRLALRRARVVAEYREFAVKDLCVMARSFRLLSASVQVLAQRGQLKGKIGRERVDLPDVGFLPWLSRRDLRRLGRKARHQRVRFHELSHYLRPLVRLRRLEELP
jgi:hypothetical protein